eukprot:TRINITY_DN1343_c2_g1_i3.p3 TRINITY_DN1343_c2_g1~~TRINITY_DN1343_c2_g1_i3.p3  ORF type:complete len:177 (-),score=81.89 TRINITY_DN1343_c2_g1_i3:567-1097(-)
MCACCKFVLTITIVFPLFGGSCSLDDGGEEAEGENPAALENEAELPLPGPAAAAPVHTDGTGGEEEDAIGAAMAGPGGDEGDAGGVDPDEPDEGPGDAPDAQSAEEEEAEELEGGDVARFVRELARETPARRREMVEELREDYPKLATIVDHALVQADALAKEEEDEEEEEDEDEL